MESSTRSPRSLRLTIVVGTAFLLAALGWASVRAEELAPLTKKQVKEGLMTPAFVEAMLACMEGYHPPGPLWLNVSVSKSGQLTILAMKPMPPSTDVDECIRDAAQHARFPESSKITTVMFPFPTGHESGLWMEKEPPTATEEPAMADPAVATDQGAIPEGEEEVDDEAETGGEPSCIPDCRKGFFCHQGECISMCNPPLRPGRLAGQQGILKEPESRYRRMTGSMTTYLESRFSTIWLACMLSTMSFSDPGFTDLPVLVSMTRLISDHVAPDADASKARECSFVDRSSR